MTEAAGTGRRRRRRTPIQGVVEFFMSAAPEDATQGLEIAQAIMEARAGQAVGQSRVTGRMPKPQAPLSLVSSPGEGTPQAGVPAAPRPHRRRKASPGRPRGSRKGAAATDEAATGAGTPQAPEAPAPRRRRRPAVEGAGGAPVAAAPAEPDPLPEQVPPGDDSPDEGGD